MTLIRRILKLAGAALAFAVYVWLAAVRNVPRVKARKALRRSAQRRPAQRRPAQRRRRP